MTIQEKAQALIAMSAEQAESLREWALAEDMAFEAFASQYVPHDPVGFCKGCHT
jgi:hypothetical protein